MAEPQISISAQQLTKRFGSQTAVQDLSFEIQKGEIVGFLGPNGAGKSTTLRILTGVLPATSGCAYVAGLPVSLNAREIRGKIGYMPENNPLPEDMRVIEYLRFRARIKGIPWRQQRQRIEHAMELCELHRKARRKTIGTLSKGFRQRVGIADAILAQPEITILDEPTIGLDPHQVIGIRKLLNDLRGQTTVIFSSHILSEVEISCDRVLILNQGQLVASGTAAQLREDFLLGQRFRILFQGDPATAEALAKQCAPDCQLVPVSTNDATHEMEIHAPKSAADCGAALLKQLSHASNLTLLGFHRMDPTLEDIFLTATRRSWEQVEPLP